MRAVPTTVGVLLAMTLPMALPPAASIASSSSPDATLVFVNGDRYDGSVDLCADTTVVATDVASAPVVVTLPGGTYDFKTVPHQSSPSCAAPAGPQHLTQVQVASGASLSLVTNHLSPFIDLFDDPTSPVAAGHGRVAIYHAVVFGPIDLLVDGQTALTQIGQGQVQSTDLPAGSHDLRGVASTGNLPDVFDLSAQAVSSGQLVQVFVVGGARNGGGPFSVVVNTRSLSVTTPTTVPPTTAPPTTAPPAPATPGTASFTG